jgi:hypothetical protein
MELRDTAALIKASMASAKMPGNTPCGLPAAAPFSIRLSRFRCGNCLALRVDLRMPSLRLLIQPQPAARALTPPVVSNWLTGDTYTPVMHAGLMLCVASF